MHRVAHVRNDEREVGQATGREVGLEPIVRNDSLAPLLAREHRIEVQEGLCFFAYRPDLAPVKPGDGRPSAYVFHVRPDSSIVSARLRASTEHLVQFESIPCVEPETKAM